MSNEITHYTIKFNEKNSLNANTNDAMNANIMNFLTGEGVTNTNSNISDDDDDDEDDYDDDEDDDDDDDEDDDEDDEDDYDDDDDEDDDSANITSNSPSSSAKTKPNEQISPAFTEVDPSLPIDTKRDQKSTEAPSVEAVAAAAAITSSMHPPPVVTQQSHVTPTSSSSPVNNKTVVAVDETKSVLTPENSSISATDKTSATATAIAAATASNTTTDNTQLLTDKMNDNLKKEPNNNDQTSEAIVASVAAVKPAPSTVQSPTIPPITTENEDNTAAIAAAVAAVTPTTTPIQSSTIPPITTENEDNAAAIAAAVAAVKSAPSTVISPTIPPITTENEDNATAIAAAVAAVKPTISQDQYKEPNPNPNPKPNTNPIELVKPKESDIISTESLKLIKTNKTDSYTIPQGIVYYINNPDDTNIYEYEQNYKNKDADDKRKVTLEGTGDDQVVKINDTPVTETNFKKSYPETTEVYGETNIKGLFEKITPFSIKAVELLKNRIEKRDTFDPNKYLSYITNQGIGYYRKKDGTDTKIYEYEQVQTNKTDRRIASIANDKLKITIDGEEFPVDKSNYNNYYPETFKVYGYEGMPNAEKAKIFEITKQNFIKVIDLFNKRPLKQNP